jgi:hypothetical protein
MRLIERMTNLASQSADTLQLQTLHARWMHLLMRGRIDDAILAADHGRAIYRSEAHHASGFMYGNHDPGCVPCHSRRWRWHSAVTRSRPLLNCTKPLRLPRNSATR